MPRKTTLNCRVNNNNPGVYFWAVGIGTNDGEAGTFEQNLRGIINTLISNGKQPVLARVPYSTSLPDNRIQSFNAVIDRLRGEYDLPAGPDLYTHFRNNPSHLHDGIHPGTAGVSAIQELWAQAACTLSREGSNGNGASCSEKELLEHFGKNRLMVGAMAGDAFFRQNLNLMDVRYLYLADRIFSSETPCTSCSPECRELWWGCWEQPAGRYLTRFLETAESGGQIPMITYYTFAQTSGNEAQVSPANELSFSRRYFNDWRFMLQQIGQRKVLLHIEPDLWGYAQHRNRESPLNLPAVVRAANPTDCASFEDNFAGFSRCLISMVRKYAPNAKVGLHASAWATGEFDLNINTNPNRDIRSHAVEVGNYLRRLGAAEADFLVLEALDRDADYYRIHRGENRWWNQNQTLPNFAQHFQWAKELRSVVGKPLVWWQVPVGHENSPNVPVTNPNQQSPQQGYRDNRVDYFLAHMDEVVSLGGVLVAFGAGAGDQTTPLTDGGNLARRASSYKQSSAGFGFCATP